MNKDRFTGLYHTHFREYDPVHGRWLSIDPAGYRDGLNLYAAYMGVNGIDPLGLDYLKVRGNTALWITENQGIFNDSEVEEIPVGYVKDGIINLLGGGKVTVKWAKETALNHTYMGGMDFENATKHAIKALSGNLSLNASQRSEGHSMGAATGKGFAIGTGKGAQGIGVALTGGLFNAESSLLGDEWLGWVDVNDKHVQMGLWGERVSIGATGGAVALPYIASGYWTANAWIATKLTVGKGATATVLSIIFSSAEHTLPKGLRNLKTWQQAETALGMTPQNASPFWKMIQAKQITYAIKPSILQFLDGVAPTFPSTNMGAAGSLASSIVEYFIDEGEKNNNND